MFSGIRFHMVLYSQVPNKRWGEWGRGAQNKRESRRSLLNLINGEVKINGGEVGISKYPLILLTNEKRGINV